MKAGLQTMRWVVSLACAMVIAFAVSGGGASVFAQAPANPHGQTKLALECGACHTTNGWRTLREPMAFDHTRQTAFALTGRHAEVGCAACHLDLRYDRPRIAARDCASCHLDVHQGKLSADCASCHNTRSFREAAGIEQHARGRFPLTGAHVQISCESCHRDDRGGAFTALDSDCYSCHRQDYESARSVDHKAGGLPRECQQCHATSSWHTSTFDHGVVAKGFALNGKHAQVECAGCHTGGTGPLKFTPSGPNDCVACHRAAYDKEHSGTGFPLDCTSCHTVNGWERNAFDHAASGHGFALLGKHAVAPCTACHLPPDNKLKFQTTNADDCVGCHQPDYDREHTGSGYPTACGRCHSVNGWSGANFDHAGAASGYVLEGQHARVPCTDCHTGPDLTLKWPKPATNQECVACHRPDYDREHSGSGYPVTCRTCHDANDWTHAVFDHVKSGNGFVLAGAHAKAQCTSCHGASNVLKFPKPANVNDCLACHRPDYDREHTGTNFPLTCGTCHNQNTFTGATFDHGTTGFAWPARTPRRSAPTATVPDNVLKFPKPANVNDCVACHRPDYDREHTGTNFPLTCGTCHNQNTFTGATFDHTTTGFSLVGAHITVQCSSCHGANNVLKFPKPANQDDCLACHQADYNTAHTGSMYPTTCLTCHNTTVFKGAIFNHDGQFFPVYSGSHRGRWNNCADCHPSASDFGIFTCISCHAHNKTEMDSQHRGRAGYVYDSIKCLSCHPTGRT